MLANCSAVETSPLAVIPSSVAFKHTAGDSMSRQTIIINNLQQRAADLSERQLTIGTGSANQALYDSGDRNSQ